MTGPAYLTVAQLLAAASDDLRRNSYVEAVAPEDWPDTYRLFEDPYGIVAVACYETWADLASGWFEAQALLVTEISNYLAHREAKSWEGYLVLLTPGLVEAADAPNVSAIRYNTSRVRKIVGTGDQLRTLAEVRELLLPLLPLDVEGANAGLSLLNQLPALLQSERVPIEASEVMIDAFVENRSILQALHSWRSGP